MSMNRDVINMSIIQCPAGEPQLELPSQAAEQQSLQANASIMDDLEHAMALGKAAGLQAAICSTVRHMANFGAGQLPEVC